MMRYKPVNIVGEVEQWIRVVSCKRGDTREARNEAGDARCKVRGVGYEVGWVRIASVFGS